MESHEEDYQCSDCGATVPADAKTCQKCGASLEETSEEDAFEEIPVTSHPANLSSILSLLDASKIEYFINDNAMENIWGPTFTQVPRLLIRKEQVEEVQEIINSIQEEVEVIDTDVFKKENLERVAKKAQIKGVEGWLLFFSMILIFSPIAYLPYTISDFVESQKLLEWYSPLDTVAAIDIILETLISFYGIYAGIKLWRVRADAIRIATRYLNLLLVYTLVSLFLIIIIYLFFNIVFNQLTLTIFGFQFDITYGTILFIMIWKIYLKNSERVKNTFSVE